MSKKWSFLKFMSLPGAVIIGLLIFAGYMAWRECKINSHLVEESLRGNRNAIAIMAKYEKPWKLDHRLVYGAVEGNPNALEVLKITPETSSRE
jgi:hypothetical protein